jgi:hypothetical protein
MKPEAPVTQTRVSEIGAAEGCALMLLG